MQNNNEMTTTYMNDNWSEVSRDERFFCAELFQIIKQNKRPFNKLLVEKGIIKSVHTDYEIGYEVCFYRDYIFKYGYGPKENKNHHIKTIDDLNVTAKVSLKEKEGIKTVTKVINRFPPKRTFDLCLFLENEIIIIEAKAQQGFELGQLNSFDEDRELLKKLLGVSVNIKVIGLYSNNYTPKKDTQNYFDGLITWKEIYEKYPTPFQVLTTADSIYRKE